MKISFWLNDLKIIPKSSIYKYVFKATSMKTKDILYLAIINGNTTAFDSEREAVIFIDKHLLNKGKKTVNILKKLS